MTNRRSRVAAALLALALTVLGVSLAQAAPAPVVAPVAAAQNACGNLVGFRHVSLSSLPPEATTTYNLIRSRGPFPFPRNDGVVFGNRQGILPSCSADYYHEYTVKTPGLANRGTRRIVTGTGGEYFYTGDHYVTFSVIDV